MNEDIARDVVRSTVFGMFVLLLMMVGMLVLLLVDVQARDLGQWENSDPDLKQWYKSLMMPDSPAMPCCGTADAWYCDDVGSELVEPHVDADHPGNTTEPIVKNFCRITDDRDDAPLMRRHIAIGTRIDIPSSKMKWSKDDPQTGVVKNMSGHTLVFLSVYDSVYCFIMSSGV